MDSKDNHKTLGQLELVLGLLSLRLQALRVLVTSQGCTGEG